MLNNEETDSGMVIGQPGGPVAQRKQVLNLIWVAITGAVGVYWYIHVIVGTREPNPSSAIMIALLAAISVAGCVGAWTFNGFVLEDVANKTQAHQLTMLSAETQNALANRLQSTAIMCLALLEAIAVYGLVGSFVGSPYPNTFEWFAGISVVNLVLYRLRAYPVIFQLLDRLGGRQAGAG